MYASTNEGWRNSFKEDCRPDGEGPYWSQTWGQGRGRSTSSCGSLTASRAQRDEEPGLLEPASRGKRQRHFHVEAGLGDGSQPRHPLDSHEWQTLPRLVDQGRKSGVMCQSFAFHEVPSSRPKSFLFCWKIFCVDQKIDRSNDQLTLGPRLLTLRTFVSSDQIPLVVSSKRIVMTPYFFKGTDTVAEELSLDILKAVVTPWIKWTSQLVRCLTCFSKIASVMCQKKIFL